MKNIIIQQKQEKENLLSKNYVFREKFSFAQKFVDSDMVKVITGPRRAGKSIFSLLLFKNKQFGYLNFDDENLLKVKNYDELIKILFEVYGKVKYLLFDEIQNMQNWELFVNKLQRRGFNIIVTGSNAKLLSRELATVLTGRHIPIEILPFSFKEFLRAKNFELPSTQEQELPEIKGSILNNLNEYLKNGGFPEIVVKNIEAKTYLETLFDAVLLKDVAKRYNVRQIQKLYDLSLYLISNFSSEFTFTKLKNILDFTSVSTLQNYVSYLEETYLVFVLNRFSFKVKEQIKTAKKVYLVDNGLALAKSFQFSSNLGKLMENLVFSELLKRGFKPNQSIFYYKTRNQKEVDFVLKEGPKVNSLIQVCYEISNIDAQKREIKALLETSEELSCNNLLIITWDKEEEISINQRLIRFVPLAKWLLSTI